MRGAGWCSRLITERQHWLVIKIDHECRVAQLIPERQNGCLLKPNQQFWQLHQHDATRALPTSKHLVT